MTKENALVLQKPELSLGISFSQYPIPVVHGMVGVDVLLEIRPAIPEKDSPPMDICFVVDCSGSMGDRAGRHAMISKIQAVREALVKMVRKMSDQDRMRVIGFSETAFEIIPWTEISKADIPTIVKTLEEELRHIGSTYFKAALEMSLENDFGKQNLPLLVFLTDGNSSTAQTDHPFLVAFADQLRIRKIPIIVYGTGPDYNLNLLQQFGIRAGNGSLLYHVLSVEDLESHLTGELAFRHGFCLEHVNISVFNALAQFHSVYRFVPQEQKLEKRDSRQTEHNDRGSYISRLGNGFQSDCGSVDHLRGQTFLFHIELPMANVQEDCLFNIEVVGNKPGELPFKYAIRIPAKCTKTVSTEPEHPEVQKFKLMVEATKAIKEQDYARGAEKYTQAGRPDLAQTLVLLTARGEDEESTSRATRSFANSTSSVVLSPDDQARLRAMLGEKP